MFQDFDRADDIPVFVITGRNFLFADNDVDVDDDEKPTRMMIRVMIIILLNKSNNSEYPIQQSLDTHGQVVVVVAIPVSVTSLEEVDSVD